MNWFQRLKTGLQKSSNRIGEELKKIFKTKKLDQNTLNSLEGLLIKSDIGSETTKILINKIKNYKFDSSVKYKEIQKILSQEIENILKPVEKSINIPKKTKHPVVILIIGVNGSGKTTTIGKLTNIWKNQGYNIRVAACDTFRPAAVEQLAIWCSKSKVPIVKGKLKSDPAGIAYKALIETIKQKEDLLLIDTAGRLQNNTNLMAELSKIYRVLKKIDNDIPKEILLILDATVGQNALSQIDAFNKITPITGLIITKLDGTAKAGVIISIAKKYNIPIIAIGVGESIEDLKPFKAKDFSQAIMQL